jgi:hypothetical protein
LKWLPAELSLPAVIAAGVAQQVARVLLLLPRHGIHDGLLTWTAHSEHQVFWAGPSRSGFALQVRSLLSPGVQDAIKSVL